MLAQSLPQPSPTLKPVRIWYRDPGVYGLYPPKLRKATVLGVRDHWSGKRLLIQPEGSFFTRDLPAADVRGYVQES